MKNNEKDMSITLEEWVGIVEKIKNDSQVEGFSTRDIIKITGRSVKWVLEKLKIAIDDGIVVYSGKKKQKNIIGAISYIPVFKLVENKKK